jgi:dephospho-CoA kinase
MIVLGLTGSMGMGKSTTAGFFRKLGVPVWDADQATHRLYAQGGAAVVPIAEIFPAALADGCISRPALKAILARDRGALAQIEAIVHPLVAADRQAFVAGAKADLVVVDIPLLYEKNYQDQVDAVLLVTAPPKLQQARVMARPGMSAEIFAQLLARQMPDREKRARADHILETLSLEAAEAGVKALVAYLKGKADA